MTSGSHLSIWFFVGILLTFYGLIITGAGIYGWFAGLTHHFSLGFLGFSWKIQDIHMMLLE